MHIPPGCAFHPRCPFREDRCLTDDPPLYDIGPGRGTACHFHDKIAEASTAVKGTS